LAPYEALVQPSRMLWTRPPFQTISTSFGSRGSTRLSSCRDEIPSLVNTFWRVFDGPPADEQPRANLGVGEPVSGHAGDLDLLRGELIERFDGALASSLARREQLAPRALCERLGADLVKHLMCSAQLPAPVAAPPLAPQPLAVDQLSTGEVERPVGARQAGERLSVQDLC
jgi:hypothetical protein